MGATATCSPMKSIGFQVLRWTDRHHIDIVNGTVWDNVLLYYLSLGNVRDIVIISSVLCAPATFLSTSTYFSAGRPCDRCPCVGSHSTILLAGSCPGVFGSMPWCLWQCPTSLILLAAIL